MGKIFKQYFWVILIMLAALGLAGSAAYFSISGLSKLFAGSALQVAIMASFIEFGKLATTAALHRYWNQTKWWMKYTLTTMVVAVMIITSSGIYGFLADAYSSTSVELDKIEGQISLLDKRQEQKRDQIKSIEELKVTKTNRIKSLIDLRGQQETRIDAQLEMRSNRGARQAQSLIEQSSKEIQSLQVEVDTLTNRINRINEEIGKLDIEKLNLQNTDVATEIGPLKYMSTVLNKPMEQIINWFILMLIFVFDPLAVLLVIFASNIYDANNEKTSSGASPPEEPKLENEEAEVLDDTPEEVLEEAPEEVEAEEVLDDLPEEVEIDEIVEEDAKNEIDEESQKVIDAINSDEPEVFDYSYDFIPEEKGNQVIEYIEGESGKFERAEKATESIASIISGIDSNPLYMQILNVFFLDGQRKVGDIIPPYEVFLKDIKNRGIECPDKIVKNFLTVCNLLGIVNMADEKRVTIMKDYESSKQIISLVSK